MEEKKIIINGREAVDLGLSVKWVICNIEANKVEPMFVATLKLLKIKKSSDRFPDWKSVLDYLLPKGD